MMMTPSEKSHSTCVLRVLILQRVQALTRLKTRELPPFHEPLTEAKGALRVNLSSQTLVLPSSCVT